MVLGTFHLGQDVLKHTFSAKSVSGRKIEVRSTVSRKLQDSFLCHQLLLSLKSMSLSDIIEQQLMHDDFGPEWGRIKTCLV